METSCLLPEAHGIESSGRSVFPFWLLVFDLDGTLIDSSRDLCSAVNAALEHVGRHTLSNDLIASFIGDGAATLVERSLRAPTIAGKTNCDQDVPASLLQAALLFFLDHYRLHKLDTTTAYPGVLAALHTIRERHPKVLMAVLTNKPVHPSRDLCCALGLAEFFFANYGGDSFATKKPFPEGLLALIDEARARISRRVDTRVDTSLSGVVMIGDAPADVLAARAAGTLSLGCTYGLSTEALTQAAPDLLVSNPSEWIEGLLRLGSKTSRILETGYA